MDRTQELAMTGGGNLKNPKCITTIWLGRHAAQWSEEPITLVQLTLECPIPHWAVSYCESGFFVSPTCHGL